MKMINKFIERVNYYFDDMSQVWVFLIATLFGAIVGCFIFSIRVQTTINLVNTVLLFITLRTTWKIYKGEHSYDLLIGFDIADKVDKSENGITIKNFNSSKEIAVWATNTGNAPGSFLFAGVGKHLNDEQYKELSAKNATPELYNPELTSMEHIFVDISKMRDFERIEAGAVTKPVHFDLDNALLLVYGEVESEVKLDIVFADPLGHFYHRTIRVGNKKTATQSE